VTVPRRAAPRLRLKQSKLSPRGMGVGGWVGGGLGGMFRCLRSGRWLDLNGAVFAWGSDMNAFADLYVAFMSMLMINIGEFGLIEEMTEINK
jgi:hypothetical protein